MSKQILQTTIDTIQSRILNIRGQQIMLDRDLAKLYQVQTKVFNQAVKRNIKRFPEDFMFQLTKEELNNWRSQIVTSNDAKGLRRPPYVFTEQGISMLATILRSEIAVDISINIIRAFVQMRKRLNNNSNIFMCLNNLEEKQINTDVKQLETETKIDRILNTLESKPNNPTQGIFYNGEVFDAYLFITNLIRTAKHSLVLIDNYVDDTVLTMFTKRINGVSVTIYTKKISKQFALDVNKYNEQYPAIEVKVFQESHDRFLIIDGHSIYHIGASLKDLGKKWIAFSKMTNSAVKMLNKLNHQR